MEQRKVLVVVVWRAKKAAETRVLALHRNEGFWQSVTGGVEDNEDFEAAALREVREESGLSPTRLRSLGMEQKFVGRWGPAVERAFAFEVNGQAPPTVKIDPKEHDQAEWLTPEQAMDRVKFPFDREAICRAAFPPQPLFLTKDGDFKQDGEVVAHARTVDFLHRSLKQKADGHYVVGYGQEELDVELEDAPRFVVSYDQGKIVLRDGRTLDLDPSSLKLNKDSVLYCTVDGESARFLRSAYYEIIKDVREESVAGKAEYILHCFGRDYRLSIANKG